MGAIVGGLVGQNAARHGRQDQEGKYSEALGEFGFDVPSIEDQTLNLDRYQNTGDLNTAAEAAIAAGPSAMEGIAADPRLAAAQMAALNQLSQTGQMGMTPAEKAALDSSQRQASSLAQAKSQQILDNAARRGMGGSGSELAAQLQNAQSAADRASQNSNQISADAWNNALSAISQSGQLAGQIGNQQFQQKSDIAKAKDYINQFNTQNRQGVQQRNVANQNQANLYNTQNRQNVSNQNTGVANNEQTHNKGLYQQQFSNNMARATGRSNILQSQGNNAAAAGAAEGQGYAQTGGAVDDGIKKIFTFGAG